MERHPARTDLKSTYHSDTLHDLWISVYRKNPHQSRFNEELTAHLLSNIHARTGTLFLDAGCGTASHMLRIAKVGYSCIGIDISEGILRKAAQNINHTACDSRILLSCQRLEQMAFPDETFDLVHCRGVLMHIPLWEEALLELVRVLKKRGTLLILESNCRSMEIKLVRLIRMFRKGQSRMVQRQSGLEFWSDTGNGSYLARATDVGNLVGRLTQLGVEVTRLLSTEAFEINRFPSGTIRNGIIALNRILFRLKIPPVLSSGIAIIGKKLR